MRSRLDEIVCSDAISQFFVPLCYSDRQPLISFLYDWQTLIASVIAFLAALIPARYLYVQVQDQKKKNDIELTQRIKAALIKVPRSLVKINDYLKGCFRAWENKEPESRPEAPDEAIQVIMDAAPYVDAESFESFRQLIVLSQVFESRLTHDKGEVPLNILNMMIADIATYSYLTNRLYEYSRMEGHVKTIPYTKPSRNELEQELYRLTVPRSPNDPIHSRIEKALDERYPKRIYQPE